VGSTNDLKPAILSFVKRIVSVTLPFLPASTQGAVGHYLARSVK
jgi:hypothetical protein